MAGEPIVVPPIEPIVPPVTPPTAEPTELEKLKADLEFQKKENLEAYKKT